MGKARTLSSLVSTNALLSEGQISASEIVGQVETLRVSSISYPGDDLAADSNGGQTITVVGAGFAATPTVYVGGTIASSVSFVSSTQITFVAPAKTAGTYDVYVVNPSGATAIRVMGISYSGVPTWTTAAGSLGQYISTFSIQLQATSNSTVTYALASGSTLPAGITLSSSGLLAGTLGTDQTFSFTVVATDLENQDTPRSFQVTVGLPDPYFEYVTLLLAGNGNNTQQNNTFIDSSANNFTITRNGNTTQGTFTPYGDNWSYYFDDDVTPSSSYITTSSSSGFNTANFTLEFFINWTNVTDISSVMDIVAYDTGFSLRASTSGLFIYLIGTQYTSPTFTWNLGQWYHIALVRSGTTLYWYVDGTRIGTSSVPSTAIITGPARIGGILGGGVYASSKYISNLRFVNSALYTGATLTVPTAPLENISGTVLLTCQSNRFKDSSSLNVAITPTGTTTTVRRNSPFNPTSNYIEAVNGGSAYFDGTGDALTIPYSSTFNYGPSNPFTLDFWFFPLAGGDDNIHIAASHTGQNDATLNWLCRQTAANKLRFVMIPAGGGAVPNDSADSFVLRAWNHVAVVMTGNAIKLWLNGVYQSSVSFAGTMQVNGGITIGAWTGSYTGYISNFRYTTAQVYTGVSNITPPTAPTTTIANTQLLCNFTNAGVIDNAMMNNLETVGSAQTSTSIVKYGSSSLYFNGSSDFLKIPYNATFNIGAATDYTVEAWIYPTQHGEIIGAFNLNGPNFAGWLLSTNFLSRLGKLSTYFANTTTAQSTIYSSATISLNTWTHIALVKQGSTIKLFINGSLDTTGTLTLTPSGSNQQIHIGADSNSLTSPGRNFGGYIDDLRITSGYARYTTNFTPPSAHKLK